MTHDQSAILAVCAVAMLLFAWGRWRFDLVGLLSLVAAVLLGAVPADGAFAGFADPAVAAIAAVLVISAAVRDSGLLDAPRPAFALLPRWTGLEVGVIGGVAAALSAVMNNFDAYAAMLPAARATVRRSRRSPAPLVAAIGAASLLGGLVTAIGTPPNLLASSLRRDVVGAPFGVFDFAPVGAAVAVAGVLFLAVAWRLLPGEQRRERDEETSLAGDSYTSEVAVPAGSPLVGQTVAALRARADRTVAVAAIIREGYRRIVPRRDFEIAAGDVLVLNCEPDALQALMERAGSLIVGGGTAGLDPDRIGVVEAVVTPTSELVGRSPGEAGLDERHRMGLLAIGRRGGAIVARLRRTKLRAGDVLVLQGELDAMAPTLSTLGCLTLAERRLRLGRRRLVAVPALLLAGALALAALGALPLAVALLCAVAALVGARVFTMAEVYGSVAWPMVVLFGTLLPISAALRRSGAADMLAGHLAALAQTVPAGWTVGLTLAVALLASPAINGAATVLMLGPVAAALAGRLGVSADPYLMAVAVGASCDFFSPIGSRANILSLGADRHAPRPPRRLGFALMLVVAVVGTASILTVWPLR
ncbi:SLC13 family permease [Lichenibacterium minor]|uniref:SLC13 family permease n=1 Tax=Lichenibacterium minor TaxID=2316528 RepID=A0A4V1RV10_9HYPH|nr:SLC13 family permease [Lichenibacterium minor]RYC33024.1 SLC13 family permease [Lichenibacterium minor]